MRKQSKQCECHQCIEDFNLKGDVTGTDFVDETPLSFRKMILCPDCGCKRCPKATNHRFDCTGSNEPGQAGSRYE